MHNNLVKNITGVETFNPDILETIADLSNDEVFTPPMVANKMLDTLPQHVWTNPHLKWLDPSVKTGVFLREAAKRLLDGLKNPVTHDLALKENLSSNEEYRRYWVYKKMLFGIAITDLTALMSRRSLYYTKNASDPELSVYPMDTNDGNILFKNLKHTYAKDKNGNLTGSCTLCSASLEWNRGDDLESHAYPMLHANQETIIGWFKEANADIKDEVNMKFDVIIGNPPYQLNDGGGTGSSASPLYHKFIEKSILFDPSYICMIVPSRWFAGGKGLYDFRAKMLKDNRLSHIVDFPNSKDVFPSSIDIEAGVNYFLWDSSYTGIQCNFTLNEGGKIHASMRNMSEFKTFIRDEKSALIVNKVKNAHGFVSLAEIVSARKPFGLSADFKDFNDKSSDDKVKIYARGKIGYIDLNKIPKIHESYLNYKVALAKAYGGSDKPNLVTSQPLLLAPTDVCTETYLILNHFKTRQEAENMLSYAKTKFFRYMLSTLKLTQNISRDKFAYVPNLPMIESWYAAKLYKHFGLTQEEIDHIEESIREMK